MSKKLYMVYNWIGPTGPITNTKIPDVLDISKNTFNLKNPIKKFPIQGLHPLYFDLTDNTDHTNIEIVSPHYLKSNDVKFVYELEMLHNRVWDSNFKKHFGILENAFIPENVYYKIRMRQGYFLITTPMESFLEDDMLDLIHSYFQYHFIPLTQVIYLTNSINCKDVYDSYYARRNHSEKMNCEYIGSWLNILVPECQDEVLQKEYVPGPRKKTFLKFNRRYREQRVTFLLEIYKRGILDDFHISFAKNEPESNQTFLDYATNVRNYLGMNISNDQLNQLDSKLPLVLDTPDLTVFPVEKNPEEVIRFYDESLIHIIAETNFSSNIMHFTEKSLKPIMGKQPFICVGPKHSLEYMRKLGFKTFGHIWDENYDNIDNHLERLYKILDLVETISKKSEQEKIEISHQVKDIVEYNFNHMKTRKQVEVLNFIERYGE